MSSYKTLYRVFRPRVFDDVVGQDHITDILKRQVAGNKASHAYLFCGPRGTGKTSTAKILANALNCLHPQQGNPCGECDICKSFLEDSFVDIVEIDAASNNGVDSVRDIREKVTLLPASGKFKVYIIDEVHMLSIGAFNALLKTLEEPPPHGVFILATTEQRKVPATILSRCQRYDFRRIADEDIIGRMKMVAAKTDTEYTEEALELIAQQAEGALRDALSIMDQCVAASGKLTVEIVSDTLGIAPAEALGKMADSMLTEDPGGAVEQLNQALHEGMSPHNLLRDLISVLSERLAQQADQPFERANILRCVEVLIGVQSNLRYSSVPEAVLLSAVVRASVSAADIDTKDLELRIKKLERRVDLLAEELQNAKQQGEVPGKSTPATSIPQKTPIQPTKQEEVPATQPPQSAAEPSQGSAEKSKELQEKFMQLRSTLMKKNMMLYPSIKAVDRIEVQGGRLILYAEAENAPLVEMLGDEASEKVVQEVLTDIFGQQMSLQFIYEEEQQPRSNDVQMELIAQFGEENVDIIE